MSQSRSFEYARFAALLPELAAVVVRRERSAERMASAGVRLGGLLAWGVEQGTFCADLASAEIAQACQTELFKHIPPVPRGDFTVESRMREHSAAIARFKVVGQSGEPLELLVSHVAATKTIAADGLIADRLIRLIHSRPRRMSAADLAKLFRTLSLMATEEANLSEEAEGLGLGAASDWLQAPRVVQRGDQFLLETALEGSPIEDLSAACREPAYHRAVLGWARLLLEDGILQTFLRRDQIRVHGDNIGVSRWAGTCLPGHAVQAFVPALAGAAFGSSPADRIRHRSSLLGLLAYGLGITGSLEDLADLCLALISQGGPLQVARPLMPGLFIRQEQEDAPDRRGLIRVLRQIVWFRDLGLACGASDLTRPWRELAHGLQALGSLRLAGPRMPRSFGMKGREQGRGPQWRDEGNRHPPSFSASSIRRRLRSISTMQRSASAWEAT